MPALPYHSLGAVNRVLLEELPAGSPYRRTQATGMIVALKPLFRSGGSEPKRLTSPEVGSVDETATNAPGIES